MDPSWLRNPGIFPHVPSALDVFPNPALDVAFRKAADVAPRCTQSLEKEPRTCKMPSGGANDGFFKRVGL